MTAARNWVRTETIGSHLGHRLDDVKATRRPQKRIYTAKMSRLWILFDVQDGDFNFAKKETLKETLPKCWADSSVFAVNKNVVVCVGLMKKNTVVETDRAGGKVKSSADKQTDEARRMEGKIRALSCSRWVLMRVNDPQMEREVGAIRDRNRGETRKRKLLSKCSFSWTTCGWKGLCGLNMAPLAKR